MIVVADTSPLNYLIRLGHPNVLHKIYGRVLVPHAVLIEMQHIFSTDGVTVESHALAERAWKESRVGGAGFADRLIAEVAFAERVREILTFDKVFARQPRVRRLH
jgi:predicted nucleic acid-binding protein